MKAGHGDMLPVIRCYVATLARTPNITLGHKIKHKIGFIQKRCQFLTNSTTIKFILNGRAIALPFGDTYTLR